MTFRELYAVLYSRAQKSVPRHQLLMAINQIASLRGPLRDAWVKYRDRRLEARHAAETSTSTT